MTHLAACAALLVVLLQSCPQIHAQDQQYGQFDVFGAGQINNLVTSKVEVIIVFDLNNAQRDLDNLLMAFPELLPPEPGDFLREDAVKLAVRAELRGNRPALENLMRELRQSGAVRGANPVYVANSGEPIYLDNTLRCKLANGVSREQFEGAAREAGIELQLSHIENEIDGTHVYMVPRHLDIVEVAKQLDQSHTTAFARPVLIARSYFAGAPGVDVGTAPNPCTDQVLITYSVDYDGPIRLAIHRLDGSRMVQIIDSPNYPRGMSRHELDVSQWPIGTYLVHLETPFDGRTSKLVITR